MDKTKKTYHGQLYLHGYGEANDILYLSTLDNPLADQLETDLEGKMVNLRQ
jgi:hypothetical protein